MPTRPLSLGRAHALTPGATPQPFDLPPHHLVTHGVIVGMTGSGKTGLAMVLVEEALRSNVPVLMVDVKGDLPNLLLAFPSLSPAEFAPWVDAEAAAREGVTVDHVADGLATRWRDGLASWNLGAADVAALRAKTAPRVITPGSTAAEPLHVLSSLEAPSPLWQTDEEAARESLAASVSLLLRLVARDADGTRSRDHVVLALLAEARLRAGRPAGLAELLADLAAPPIRAVGALPLDEFLPPKERQDLAKDLNTLLASPTFAMWRQGAALDIAAWLRPRDGKTPAVIVSVAHLEDEERMLVLGLLFEQILAWVRGLPGTSDLRALVLFDEVFGFVPPHPANPATKRPLLSLLKQARAFGVGVVLATQNPMDLDYKALSNAGAWFVGRLQTDADRERVVEGLAGSDAARGALDPGDLAATLKSLPPRTFYVRDVHLTPSSLLLETRWTLSWLRGPMTRHELRRLARPAQPASAPPAALASVPALAAAPEATTAAAPPAPEGWRTYHGPAPAAPTSRWTYTPWIAATVVAHMRDAKLGVALNRTATIAAPLGPDGRPDVARAVHVERAHLDAAAAPNARYAPLPDVLAKKATAQAAARALRDHAYRSLELSLMVHRELGLAASEGETADAFALRCRAEALRRVALVQQELRLRHEPKLARLAARVEAARADAIAAGSDASSTPGLVGTAVLGLVAGQRTAQRAHSARAKALDRAERARRELADAEDDLRGATAARDAEWTSAQHGAETAGQQIEVRTLAPKKTDVEVVEIGVAWAVH